MRCARRALAVHTRPNWARTPHYPLAELTGEKLVRTPEQMAAISSCLTLLTNVVMAWNAGKIGEARLRAPETFPDRHLMHIAPNAHEHVNTKGIITIDVSRHRDRLLGGPPPGLKIRVAT